MTMARSLRIQAIIYANPDHYPPVVNGARVMAKAGVRLDILGREYAGLLGADYSVSYPSQTRVLRARAALGPSWLQYGMFLNEALHRANRDVDLFLGYDMHGFLAARLLATLCRRPLVYHCLDYTQSGTAASLGARWVKAFEQRFARSAAVVIVPDRERGRVMSEELRLISPPHTVANAPMHRYNLPGLALVEALTAQGKRFNRIVLRQGRIGPGHGIEATLRSIPLWNTREWGLVVMGPSEPDYARSLALLAVELGVDSQFAILPFVPYEKLPEYTPGAHVGHALYQPIHFNHLYPTTASNKIMEYMAAGLPLLVSDRPGLRVFVDKYKCGLTADEGSPGSIAAAVNTLLGDPDLASRLGAAGARAFEEEFNYELQFTPVLKAFESLCCGSERNGS